MFSKGGKGGPGRPKGSVSIKEKLHGLALEAASGEAEKSLQFLVQMRDNESLPGGTRIEAARLIIENVWGKPKQRMEMSGDVGLTIDKIGEIVQSARGERGLRG
jgi:hypothetical protein